MEARVWSGTGLLPDHLDAVRLSAMADGRWQALCEFEAGDLRELHFAAGDSAEAQVASTLRRELGFTSWAADETARRLFEPFALAEGWAW